MYSGGTMDGQNQRTVDLLEDFLANGKPLWELLWFIHDTQSDIRSLAQIAQDRALPPKRKPDAP